MASSAKKIRGVKEIATYTLRLLSEDVPAEEGSADRWYRADQRVLADFPAMLEEVQENLDDLLPEGYSVEIEKQ